MLRELVEEEKFLNQGGMYIVYILGVWGTSFEI